MQNLSQSKQRMLADAQSAIEHEKQQFLNTRQQCLINARHAVLKLMSPQVGGSEDLEKQITHALEQALEGKFSVVTEAGEKILDYNPLKQKSVLPVLKKYAVRFGVPVAAALVLTLDIASLRTHRLSLIKQGMQQQESAAEKFVQKQKVEWKEKNTFNPPTTLDYKASYVENVLYTTD